MKRVIILVLALAAGTAYLLFGTPDRGSSYAGSGTVEATEAALGFETGGRIVFIGPREGDSVKKGQELARLDRDELEARRTQAEWHLATMRSTLEDLQTGRGSPDRVTTQRALVTKAEAALRRAEAAFRNSAIKAPFDGVVTVRSHDTGEVITVGAPVLSIVDLTDRWIRIYIGVDQIGAVRLGQLATIKSDAHPGKTYGGTVSFIATRADTTPRTSQVAAEPAKLVYAVKVRITGDATVDLRPGMPVDVQLVTNSN
jgi:HlyD family secretion protein